MVSPWSCQMCTYNDLGSGKFYSRTLPDDLSLRADRAGRPPWVLGCRWKHPINRSCFAHRRICFWLWHCKAMTITSWGLQTTKKSLALAWDKTLAKPHACLWPFAKSWEKAGRSKAETLSLFQSTIKSPFFDQENGITHMGPWIREDWSLVCKKLRRRTDSEIGPSSTFLHLNDPSFQQ